MFVARPYGTRKRGEPKLRWIDCLEKDLKTINSLSECSVEIVLLWIPGLCGVTGNELVDHQAKKGASIQHTTRKAVHFTSAKRIIKKKR
ncbi:hypothetical protein TNCV_1304131 [Trichonephila clavipes]|nr:hypothetical protein TNCV_1304131 [Trichonephila clavipes]